MQREVFKQLEIPEFGLSCHSALLTGVGEGWKGPGLHQHDPAAPKRWFKDHLC